MSDKLGEGQKPGTGDSPGAGAATPAFTQIERVRRVLRGLPVDRLPAQPMSMMFAARNAGMPFIEYTKDGRNMAEAQLKLAADFGLDCLLTCSDPAREVIDIAGEGSIDWFTDQGPAINESRAALLDKERLRTIEGNVSTITDLLEGTPEKVYESCRRCHQISGRYHIVGAGCEISPLTPPENLRAMIAYAREHTPDDF